MKKLMLSLVGALAVTSATVADDNEPEVYEFTKATASSKAPYVLPKNVTNEVTKAISRALQDGGNIKQAIDDAVGDVDLSQYSTTEQMNTAIGAAKTAAETTAAGDATTKANSAKEAAIASAKTYTNRKVADIDLGAKRDKTDELVYSQTESDWDFSEVTKVNPSKIYEIKINPNTGADDTVTYSCTLWGSDASGSGTVCELEAHPDDVASANPTRLVVKSALDADVPANSIYRSLVGTVIYKRGVLTGDTLAHESEKADSEVSTVYATINSTNVVIGSAKGVPIRNMTWYYNRDNVGNIKLYNKDSGTLIGSASSYSDWNGSEPSFVATFRINDEELKLKVSNSSVSLKTGDSWGTPTSLICGMRVAKDSKCLGGKTAAEWEALISNSSKRDIRDEYHYALEWDFTEFNAIKDNVGYKVAKDEDNEYIWHVYKVVPDEEDALIANCSKVDPDEEEPTKLKIIVADLTDGDYAGLVDKIIYAYPSKTTDKFALKSDIESVQDDVDSLNAQMLKKVTQFEHENYVYTPIGTNRILSISGSFPNMKVRVYGVNALPLTGSLLNFKSTRSNLKLYVAGFENPFEPSGFLSSGDEGEDCVIPRFNVNDTLVNIQIKRTCAGFYDPNAHGWIYEDFVGDIINYTDQTAPNSHKFAGRTYEEAAADASARLEERIGHFVNATNELTIGSGATNANHMESVTLNGCQRYPSYTWGFANVNIGLDNVTGFGDDGVGGVKNSEGVLENGKAYYDVVIGTSSSAKYMHSYVFGSQAHALAYNSFIFGYGASALDSDTAIIGFGARPQPVLKFTTFNDMWNYFKSFANYTAATNALYADMMLSVTNDISHLPIFTRPSPVELNGSYYIKRVLTTPDTSGSWAELYQNTPHPNRDEYIAGRHNWNYGKTHGRGTVNLVAKGDGVHDYGPANVYINDKSLNEWIGVHTGEPTYKTPYNKGLGGTPVLCESDKTVEIGINARATETSSSCQSIAIGRDALSDGSANVAVGPNAFACGNQTIAMGWRANAVGDHSISIGIAKMSGQDFYKDGEVNPNSDLALANGTEAINVGYNGKAVGTRAITVGAMTRADAPQAIQIGHGTNHVEDSFQVRDYLFARRGEFKVGGVTVVKNGELVGGTVEATETDLSEASTVDDMTVLKLKSGSNVTVLPKISATEFEELAIEPAVVGGKRNYTVTLPNEPNLQDGLPIQVRSELPEGTKLVFRNGTKVFNKLPVQIKSEQPYDKLVIYTIDVLDDGTDWTPVVNRNNIGYSNGKFTSYGTTALRGHNLHAATEFKIVYPTETGVKTNDVLNLSSGQEFSLTHLYRSANMGVGTLDVSADIHAIDRNGNCWFDVIYKTVNGTATITRKTFNTFTGITPESEGLRRIGSLEWVTEGGDNPANGYFVITTNTTSKIIVNPSEVALKYVLSNNTTNTVLMSAMTGVTESDDEPYSGYKTPMIAGVKLDTTNKVEYITINSDITNRMYKVVSQR